MLLLLIGLLLLLGAAGADAPAAAFASSAIMPTTRCLVESMARQDTCSLRYPTNAMSGAQCRCDRLA